MCVREFAEVFFSVQPIQHHVWTVVALCLVIVVSVGEGGGGGHA